MCYMQLQDTMVDIIILKLGKNIQLIMILMKLLKIYHIQSQNIM